MSDLLAVIYLLCFAAIAGGAFALMTQNLRAAPSLGSSPGGGTGPRRHPEAPGPGEEVLYLDLSRERLEDLYHQAP